MKIAIVALALLSSLSAFAGNTEFAKLVPGKEILIDSANKDVISLVLETKSKIEQAKPTYKLVKQWSGFQCEFKQTVLLNSSYNLESKTYKNTWEIQLTWTPGADLSGCIVKVSFPGMEDSRAEIFMNY